MFNGRLNLAASVAPHPIESLEFRQAGPRPGTGWVLGKVVWFAGQWAISVSTLCGPRRRYVGSLFLVRLNGRGFGASPSEMDEMVTHGGRSGGGRRECACLFPREIDDPLVGIENTDPEAGRVELATTRQSSYHGGKSSSSDE